MITVEADRINYEVRINGHAGYSEVKGTDIVCAAMSILYYSLGQMLTDHEGQLISLEMKEGQNGYYMKFIPQEGYAAIIETIYEMFVTGVRLLHEHYPDHVLLISKG